ncbi:hypothetical protein PoB_004896500 [Plakobranchus ocellatus]|uniref:Uncharacterized protein n=1 Tax=Plakobranchus ocellatus TaxID=259542 RepID=A0AAV4BT40_9GAST|nr:hypothetical protein PoB_004896500 [Plakobranchus ocellatus]
MVVVVVLAAVVVEVIVLVMLAEMVGMVVVMVVVMVMAMAMSGVAVVLTKVIVAIVLQMVVVVVMVVVMADRLGRAVCTRAKTIGFAKDPTVLILVINSIAKPGLYRTCLGFAGYVPLDYVRRNQVLHRPANHKASLIMVPAVGGTVNRKSASDLKGVFCHEFELYDRCSGLIENLETSDQETSDEENANQARISLSPS